jgi:hypothetical protein
MTAATSALEWQADQARVQLTLSGFQAGTTGLQVVRIPEATGVASLVRGARAITVADVDDTIVLFDYEFPAGQAVQYGYFQLPDTTRYDIGTEAQAFDVARPWLKHVTRPFLNRPVRLDAKVTPYTHNLRAVVTATQRSALPLGGGDVRGGRAFGITVKTDTVVDGRAIDDLIKVGGIVFWQPPSGWALPEPGYVEITAAAEHARGAVNSGWRAFDLTLSEVAPPSADVAASAITWNDVVAAYATWDDLVAAVPTWNDLLEQVAQPTEVVV